MATCYLLYLIYRATYVCSKRAPWAKPTARMSEGDGLDTYPTVVAPQFFAKAQVQANYMQWDLSEVLQGAKS
ncbi:MAG: hypothetical protein ACI3ZB_11385 [Prevotella sp.]